MSAQVRVTTPLSHSGTYNCSTVFDTKITLGVTIPLRQEKNKEKCLHGAFMHKAQRQYTPLQLIFASRTQPHGHCRQGAWEVESWQSLPQAVHRRANPNAELP